MRMTLAVLTGLTLTAWALADPPGPPARKQRRDKAVQAGGEGAAAMIRRHGDPAVDALLKCEGDGLRVQLREAERVLTRGGGAKDRPDGAAALVAHWKAGHLDKLPDPKAALAAVAQHGEEVAAFVISHHAELCDPETFEAFVKEPCEYAWGLRELSEGVARLRAEKKRQPEKGEPPGWWERWRTAVFVLGGVLALVALVAAVGRRR